MPRTPKRFEKIKAQPLPSAPASRPFKALRQPAFPKAPSKTLWYCHPNPYSSIPILTERDQAELRSRRRDLLACSTLTCTCCCRCHAGPTTCDWMIYHDTPAPGFHFIRH